MEQQLAALGLGVGAAVAEALAIRREPMRWEDLREALGDGLSSRGTLTKTLTRLGHAGVVHKRDGLYELAHPARTQLLLEVAAELAADIAAEGARSADARARVLRGARVRPVEDLPA